MSDSGKVVAALRAYVRAQGRMLDRWADGDDNVKRDLWRDLHACEEPARAALEVLPRHIKRIIEEDVETDAAGIRSARVTVVFRWWYLPIAWWYARKLRPIEDKQ